MTDLVRRIPCRTEDAVETGVLLHTRMACGKRTGWLCFRDCVRCPYTALSRAPDFCASGSVGTNSDVK